MKCFHISSLFCSCLDLSLYIKIQTFNSFIFIKYAQNLATEILFASRMYFVGYSKTQSIERTKQTCNPKSDQRFNLTRWDKLEKFFDFPLCFSTREAAFPYTLPPPFLCQKRERSGHPKRNEQVWPFASMSAYIINQHKKSLKWFEKIF